MKETCRKIRLSHACLGNTKCLAGSYTLGIPYRGAVSVCGTLHPRWDSSTEDIKEITKSKGIIPAVLCIGDARVPVDIVGGAASTDGGLIFMTGEDASIYIEVEKN